jgi:hypothetical protein
MAAATNPTPPNDPDKWKAVLRACGFNDITQSYIGLHGILTANNFAASPYSQVDLFVDGIKRPSYFPAPPQGSTETILLEYSAIIKLKALRAYLDYLKARGQALNPDSFGSAGKITSRSAGRMILLLLLRSVRSQSMYPKI